MVAKSLADRVAALEAEVERLKGKIEGMAGDGIPWWKKIWGAFAGDPAFEEAMRLGREYRESLRPKPTRERKPKNVGPRHRSR
jgi:hypothetical protein